MAPQRQNIFLTDIQMIFRNFQGAPSQFNRDGDRNFCVLLNEEQVEVCEQAGLRIKYTKPRDEYDEPQPYIKVKVSYKYTPPRAFLVNAKRKTRTRLDEGSIATLDYIHQFERVDLTLQTSRWENKPTNQSGWSAYLASLYATPVLDEVDELYADYPEDDEIQGVEMDPEDSQETPF